MAKVRITQKAKVKIKKKNEKWKQKENKNVGGIIANKTIKTLRK